MCTEISGHWKAFATETEKAISERRDKLYSGQYDGVTETTVAAYSLHEIESLKKSTLISNLDFYPRLTDSIISFIRKNGQTTTDTRSRVTFFSTMLPRHYFMFPHARAGRVKGLAFTRVSYPEPFVDDYKKRLHDMIDSSADKVLFSRYTVVAEDIDVRDTWAMSPPNSLAATEPLPLLTDFMNDAKRFLSPKVTLDNFTWTGATLADVLYSMGMTVGKKSRFRVKWLEEILPRHVTQIHLLCEHPHTSLPNLVETFAKDYHSPESCRLLIITPNGRSRLGPDAPDIAPLKSLGVCPTLCNIGDFLVSPDSVHFSRNGSEPLEACVVANIDLRNKSVTLRYAASDFRPDDDMDASDTRLLHTYKGFIDSLEGAVGEIVREPTTVDLQSVAERAGNKFDIILRQFKRHHKSDTFKRLVAFRKEWPRYSETEYAKLDHALDERFDQIVSFHTAVKKCVGQT
jgi:hypothetical protein